MEKGVDSSPRDVGEDDESLEQSSNSIASHDSVIEDTQPPELHPEQQQQVEHEQPSQEPPIPQQRSPQRQMLQDEAAEDDGNFSTEATHLISKDCFRRLTTSIARLLGQFAPKSVDAGTESMIIQCQRALQIAASTIKEPPPPPALDEGSTVSQLQQSVYQLKYLHARKTEETKRLQELLEKRGRWIQHVRETLYKELLSLREHVFQAGKSAGNREEYEPAFVLSLEYVNLLVSAEVEKGVWAQAGAMSGRGGGAGTGGGGAAAGGQKKAGGSGDTVDSVFLKLKQDMGLTRARIEARFKKIISAKDTELGELQKELKMTKMELNNAVANYEARISSLTQELQQTQMDAMSSHESVLQNFHEKSNKEISALTDELDRAKSTCQRLRLELDISKEDNMRYQSKIADHAREIEDKLQEVAMEKKVMEEAIERRKAADAEDYQSSIKLQQELDEKTLELQQASKERDRAKRMQADAEEKKEEAIREKQQLQEQVREAAQKEKAAQFALTALRERVKKMELDAETSNQVYEKMLSELREARENDKKSALAELEQEKTKLASLHRENSMLVTESRDANAMQVKNILTAGRIPKKEIHTQTDAFLEEMYAATASKRPPPPSMIEILDALNRMPHEQLLSLLTSLKVLDRVKGSSSSGFASMMSPSSSSVASSAKQHHPPSRKLATVVNAPGPAVAAVGATKPPPSPPGRGSSPLTSFVDSGRSTPSSPVRPRPRSRQISDPPSSQFLSPNDDPFGISILDPGSDSEDVFSSDRLFARPIRSSPSSSSPSSRSPSREMRRRPQQSEPEPSSAGQSLAVDARASSPPPRTPSPTSFLLPQQDQNMISEPEEHYQLEEQREDSLSLRVDSDSKTQKKKQKSTAPVEAASGRPNNADSTISFASKKHIHMKGSATKQHHDVPFSMTEDAMRGRESMEQLKNTIVQKQLDAASDERKRLAEVEQQLRKLDPSLVASMMEGMDFSRDAFLIQELRKMNEIFGSADSVLKNNVQQLPPHLLHLLKVSSSQSVNNNSNSSNSSNSGPQQEKLSRHDSLLKQSIAQSAASAAASASAQPSMLEIKKPQRAINYLNGGGAPKVQHDSDEELQSSSSSSSLARNNSSSSLSSFTPSRSSRHGTRGLTSSEVGKNGAPPIRPSAINQEPGSEPDISGFAGDHSPHGSQDWLDSLQTVDSFEPQYITQAAASKSSGPTRRRVVSFPQSRVSDEDFVSAGSIHVVNYRSQEKVHSSSSEQQHQQFHPQNSQHEEEDLPIANATKPQAHSHTPPPPSRSDSRIRRDPMQILGFADANGSPLQSAPSRISPPPQPFSPSSSVAEQHLNRGHPADEKAAVVVHLPLNASFPSKNDKFHWHHSQQIMSRPSTSMQPSSYISSPPPPPPPLVQSASSSIMSSPTPAPLSSLSSQSQLPLLSSPLQDGGSSPSILTSPFGGLQRTKTSKTASMLIRSDEEPLFTSSSESLELGGVPFRSHVGGLGYVVDVQTEKQQIQRDSSSATLAAFKVAKSSRPKTSAASGSSIPRSSSSMGR